MTLSNQTMSFASKSATPDTLHKIGQRSMLAGGCPFQGRYRSAEGVRASGDVTSICLQLLRRYGPMASLLGVLAACGHQAPDALMLIEVHVDHCMPETCLQGAARLEKLLAVQLAVNSDCTRIHTFLSRNEWMLAKTPATAKHWTLTVAESLTPSPGQLTWLLSGPGKNYRGAANPSQTIKDVCRRVD